MAASRTDLTSEVLRLPFSGWRAQCRSNKEFCVSCSPAGIRKENLMTCANFAWTVHRHRLTAEDEWRLAGGDHAQKALPRTWSTTRGASRLHSFWFVFPSFLCFLFLPCSSPVRYFPRSPRTTHCWRASLTDTWTAHALTHTGLAHRTIWVPGGDREGGNSGVRSRRRPPPHSQPPHVNLRAPIGVLVRGTTGPAGARERCLHSFPVSPEG